MDTITWYATTLDLTTDWRGPIELPEALRVVDEYAARLRTDDASGEEALAETWFGFSRYSDDFIEICLHTPTVISFSVEFKAHLQAHA